MLRIAVAVLAVATLTSTAHAHQAVDPKILQMVPNDDDAVPDKSIDARIRRGRDLFLNETFKGNGRTCGTCHEPTNNFTIDPAFIATLPQSSPLFVAENNPNLRGLEDPQLLRQGLICENLDGFPNPPTLPSTTTCVFRNVPHTLALRTSTIPRADFPLVNATGWSGDGSPGEGSLFNFAVGAVVQHFPKDQQRRPGIDFKVPTKNQLTDLLMFQLSLGRQSDVSLDGDSGPELVFSDANAEIGKRLFVDGVPGRNGTVRSCAACHDEAGANDQNGANRQFNTGISRLPTSPTCTSNVAPGDGGFGATPVVTTIICNPGKTVVFRGDGTFNTPPIIEAADTSPFFHNGAISGPIENAVAFYTSDTFNASPSGNGNAFVLTQTQINQIGALLRALNSRENVKNSITVSTRASGESQPLGAKSLQEALSETVDALGVLNTAPVPLYSGTTIRPLLTSAAGLQQKAATQNGSARRSSIAAAIANLRQAQSQFTN